MLSFNPANKSINCYSHCIDEKMRLSKVEEFVRKWQSDVSNTKP